MMLGPVSYLTVVILALLTVHHVEGGTTTRLKDLQQFIEEPQSVEVKEGVNVSLVCRVKSKLGTLQWTKDDFGLGTDRELAGFARYKMEGEDETTWNLAIANVSLEDGGRYQCQVGATDTAAPIRSAYAELSVLAAPQAPVITAGPKLVLREGRKAMVQCISKGGRPASTVRWLKSTPGDSNGAVEEIVDGVDSKTETMSDGKRMATVSTLTFAAVNRSLAGTVLECEAWNAAVEAEPRVVKTRLEVEFEPRVELKVEPSAIYEGDAVRVSCEVEAVPAEVEYRWEVGGEEVVEARGAKELVIDTDRGMHGKSVSCTARNKLGQSSAQIDLDVKYSPVFVESPVDVVGDAGERVQLDCSVDTNPTPTYTWTKQQIATEEVIEVGRGSSLSLVLSNQTVGRYTCHAEVTGFPGVTSSSLVQMRGPPLILPGRELQFGTVGQPLHVVCEAESVPEADNFGWRFRGRELRPGSPLYSLLETRLGNTVRSTLVIDASEEKHYGEYECTVTNNIGASNLKIVVKEIEPFPLLVVVAGAIGGLLLTVVVLVIILACRRALKSPPDLSAWPRSQSQQQSDRLSTSSTTNTSSTSSNCQTGVGPMGTTNINHGLEDDLDGSDSLPEYHANYVSNKGTTGGSSGTGSSSLAAHNTTPDLLHSNLIYGAGTIDTYTGKIVYAANNGSQPHDNYAPYNGFGGSHGNLLVDTVSGAKFAPPTYSSPYLQTSVSPVSEDLMMGGGPGLGMDNSNSNGSAAHHHHHHFHHHGHNAGYGGGGYGARASGRFNAVAHSLQTEAGAGVDLNESSVGTHV